MAKRPTAKYIKRQKALLGGYMRNLRWAYEYIRRLERQLSRWDNKEYVLRSRLIPEEQKRLEREDLQVIANQYGAPVVGSFRAVWPDSVKH